MPPLPFCQDTHAYTYTRQHTLTRLHTPSNTHTRAHTHTPANTHTYKHSHLHTHLQHYTPAYTHLRKHERYCDLFNIHYTAVFCFDPPLISNATCKSELHLEPQLVVNHYPYNAIIYCVCLGGRKFPDGKKQWTIFCGTDGSWNATDTSCECKNDF